MSEAGGPASAGPSTSSPSTAGGLARHLRLRSATALVIANMIGAGIFTTTGFQAADLRHPQLILALWVVGGLLALLGALCYGELGAMMPEAGAEYVYLRETYGPAFGFMSAFVSLILFFPRSRYAVIPVAIWLAATRTVSGAHYPSDVMAGLALGFGAAVLTAIVFARLGYVFRQKPAGLPEPKRTFFFLW